VDFTSPLFVAGRNLRVRGLLLASHLSLQRRTAGNECHSDHLRYRTDRSSASEAPALRRGTEMPACSQAIDLAGRSSCCSMPLYAGLRLRR
jgi:hypothetical protein